MNKKIMESLGFKKEVEMFEKGQCPFCQKFIDDEYEFRDELSAKEYKISEKCVHKKLTKLNEKTGRNTSDCDILKVMQCRNCSFKQTAEERRLSEETAAQRLRSLTVEMIRYLEEKYGIFINERG